MRLGEFIRLQPPYLAVNLRKNPGPLRRERITKQFNEMVSPAGRWLARP